MPAATPKQPMIGPFPGHVRPVWNRPGLYLRISKKTGERVWSYWDGQQFFMFSNTKRGAMSTFRRGKVSNYQSLPWFGMAKPRT
jgi:hypothetical protein